MEICAQYVLHLFKLLLIYDVKVQNSYHLLKAPDRKEKIQNIGLRFPLEKLFVS